MNEPVTDREIAGILDMLAEAERLRKLTNAELVAECVELNAADCNVVVEMMTRLDPKWFEEKEKP